MAAMVSQIRAAGALDWRATGWLLERLFPEEFSLKTNQQVVNVVQHTGVNGPRIVDEEVKKRFYEIHLALKEECKRQEAEREPTPIAPAEVRNALGTEEVLYAETETVSEGIGTVSPASLTSPADPTTTPAAVPVPTAPLAPGNGEPAPKWKWEWPSK